LTISANLSIHERLKQIRHANGWTQPEFAKLLRIPTRSYKNYELGIRELPVGVAVTMCMTMNISFRWLLVGLGEMRHTATVDDITHMIDDRNTYLNMELEQLTESFYEDKITAEVFKLESSKIRNDIKSNDKFAADLRSKADYFYEDAKQVLARTALYKE
jgi:transcriptional regulator with XRE-family HTH domain